mmetsp:Transcript_42281/g.99172  ORF Transcript_42281/g.99172 Transcript_42281/m.99172 type:complete len:108 (-) Transcript_42281:103-426(-)
MASVSDDGAVCRFGLACPTPQGEWHRGQRVLARSGDGVYHHATVTHLLPPGDGRRCGEAAAVKYRAAGWGSEGLLVLGRGPVLPDDTSCRGCTTGHANTEPLRQWVT